MYQDIWLNGLIEVNEIMETERKFNIAIEKWPDEISLSGSKIIEKTNGFLSPKLNEYRDKIESEDSDDLDLIHWAIFQEFHRVSKNNFIQGKQSTLKSSLSMERILNEIR